MRRWIIKDAHSSNGFSAALFDRLSRPLEPTDVPGGYCYVVQQYVDRPLLLGGRKFELRQYVLLCGDGAGFTYSTALLRLASVPYELRSEDRRAHITNKYVQTGWESTSELVGSLDDIEWTSARWPGYERLLEASLLPLLRDLLDVLQPLLERGRRAAPASASPLHFELFACDLVVTAEGVAHLMEVNINPAFGAFSEATQAALVRPLFADLAALVLLPAAGEPPRAGRFRQIRAAGQGAAATVAGSVADGEGGGEAGGSGGSGGAGADSAGGSDRKGGSGAGGGGVGLPPKAVDDLAAHTAYMLFKKSHRKRYERQPKPSPLWRGAAGGAGESAGSSCMSAAATSNGRL